MTTATTEYGTVSGSDIGDLHQFLGIPYAAPPVGQLRWQPPVPPSSWAGAKDTTTYGNAPLQARAAVDAGAPQNEDCLYLNVWTSTLDATVQQPVMVWIHGGGFLNGAASMPDWVPRDLTRHGITVVSINYRLHAFGFLTHPDITSNLAVLDWVAALHWVSRNIASFGGDPDNVTIFGQSAGGAAVRTLLSTPSAEGHFHRAVMQSAGFDNYAAGPSPSHERIETVSAELFDRLGTDDLAQLSALPAAAVRDACAGLPGSFPPAGHVHTPANLVWYPTPDGSVVFDDLCPWARDIPVLSGHTRDEARFFFTPDGMFGFPGIDPASVYTAQTLAAMAEAFGGDRAGDLLDYFTDAGSSPFEALVELVTTAVWTEPALATARSFETAGITGFGYRFDRVSPAAQASGRLAHHSAEIPYLFGHVGTDDFDDHDAAVSDAVQYAWTQFARDGVPRHRNGTPWLTYTSDRQLTIIGDDVRSEPWPSDPLTSMITSARTRR